MFKITVNIINTDSSLMPNDKRSYNDTGVLKTILIAVVEDIKECYENLKQIFNHIEGLTNTKYHICSDLKLVNIILGIQSPYSESNDLTSDYEYAHRTFGGIKQNAHNFTVSGYLLKDDKNFKNCILNPVIPADDDSLTIDICTPPELHLLQGAVKHIYNNMEGVAWGRTLAQTHTCTTPFLSQWGI